VPVWACCRILLEIEVKARISPNCRIRHREHFAIGDDSIVDDYCYFSTTVRIGRSTHIASGCSVAGGAARVFEIGDFSSLSSGVKIWCTSDDFANDLVTIIPDGCEQVKTHLISGDVFLGDYTAVGSNSVVMPDNRMPEGTVIGALSFVPVRYTFEPWTVYAGVPVRIVGRRNRKNVLEQVKRLESMLEERGEQF
jgi:acetyltransferase-like isoleucine patch superfamily enzyme